MKTRIHVFCLHRISDEKSPAYPPIPVKVFESFCKFITRFYRPVDITEALTLSPSGKPLAIVTFDDAYYDFYENALPLLVKYHIPAIQHVITQSAETGESFWTQKLNKLVEAYFAARQPIVVEEMQFQREMLNEADIETTALDLYLKLLNNSERDTIIRLMSSKLGQGIENTRMMTWKEINESTQFGIRIGSHTHSHANLTHLNHAELEKELRISQQLITRNTRNAECISLAFPNGQYNAQVVDTAVNTGYNYLFGTEPLGAKSIEPGKVIPRISIYNREAWKNLVKLTGYRLLK